MLPFRHETHLPAVLCVSALTVAALPGCGGTSTLPEAATIGDTPTLVPAQKALVPTINVVTAIGWSGADTPEPAPGMQVTAFARGLDHPRWLYVLPNGDVLVAETNAPPRPEDDQAYAAGSSTATRRRPAAGVRAPIASRCCATPTAMASPKSRSALLQDLHSPFGMALVGDDALRRQHRRRGEASRTAAGATRIDAAAHQGARPAGGRLNHHWTRNIIASPDGGSCTSRSDRTATSPSTASPRSAAAPHLGVRPRHRHARVFASGSAQPGRHGLGADHGGAVDRGQRARRARRRPRPRLHDRGQGRRLLRLAVQLLRQHVDAASSRAARPGREGDRARLRAGIAHRFAGTGFYDRHRRSGRQYPAGRFVGQHGSWNRNRAAATGSIFVPFKAAAGRTARDVLTGFVRGNGEAHGRPVGVAVAAAGPAGRRRVGNVVWRVSGAARTTTR